jgi:hypothetical protein
LGGKSKERDEKKGKGRDKMANVKAKARREKV